MKIAAKIGISHTKDINNAKITPPVGKLTSDEDSYAMYGLRKIKDDYAGNCIEVRESDGDTTANIGFDAHGNLDEAALLAHCGGNDGFVKTWYDQSGGTAFDLAQSGTGKQPKIVNSGSILRANGKPIMTFDGTNDLVKRSIGTDDGSPHSIFFVYRLDDPVAASKGILSLHETTDTAMIRTNSSKVIEINFGNTVTIANANTPDTLFQLSMIVNGASSKLALNGRNGTDPNLGSNDVELIVIGREEGTTDSNNSKMSCAELIIYSRALTDQEFQQVNNNVNGYYNLG
jgi:hypothetical protein